MSHSYRNERNFASAQQAWDNMAEPEGDEWPQECDACSGTGEVNEEDPEQRPDGMDIFMVPCQCCDGTGLLGEDGEPWREVSYD